MTHFGNILLCSVQNS